MIMMITFVTKRVCNRLGIQCRSARNEFRCHQRCLVWTTAAQHVRPCCIPCNPGSTGNPQPRFIQYPWASHDPCISKGLFSIALIHNSLWSIALMPLFCHWAIGNEVNHGPFMNPMPRIMFRRVLMCRYHLWCLNIAITLQFLHYQSVSGKVNSDSNI
jgi:hypothetical protein